MSQRMRCASAIAGASEAAFGFFHLRAHDVQVIGRRDHGEQQNECTAKGAEEDWRGRCRTIRRSPLPPQQIAWQQQREPAEIEKKLHTKNAQGSRGKHNRLNWFGLPKDNQDSTDPASDWDTSKGAEEKAGVPLIAHLAHLALSGILPQRHSSCSRWYSRNSCTCSNCRCAP